MKNIKIGFTLIEVLLALSIVGVIAATVVPMFVNDIQKQTSGASLGRAVGQIELGCLNMIQLANSERTDGSYADTLSMITEEDLGYSAKKDSVLNNLADIVVTYWGLNPDIITPPTIKKYDGTENKDDNNNDNNKIKSANSKLYSFAKTHAGVAINKGNSITASSNPTEDTGYIIYIDTNGWDTLPNCAGKDIFAFKLLNNGKLAPSADIGTEAGNYGKQAIEHGFKLDY